MIVILDYGTGNLTSIKNMLKKIGYNSTITSDINVLKNASKIILPGVGSFDNAMQSIERLGFDNVLHHKALVEKIPVLGICLGMQLLTKGSEEGVKKGLGWIDGYVRKFRTSDFPNIKIPHMGWNIVNFSEDKVLFKGLESGQARFYFVHSYHVVCETSKNVLATSDYGYNFECGIFEGNVFGVQFHPEKSHKFGMQLYDNFCKI